MCSQRARRKTAKFLPVVRAPVFKHAKQVASSHGHPVTQAAGLVMRLSVQGELLSTVWIVELVGRGTEARRVHTWVREAEAVNVHDALEEKQLIAEFLRV